MALLKRISASTLMETLVATVLIVIVFMISSLVLNSLFSNSLRQNTNVIDHRLNQLEYEYANGALVLPYYEDMGNWEITVTREYYESQGFLRFETINTATQKQIINTIPDDH
ncbi:hypothetical protein [Spongiimicrobium sp. 3-5]|uniref:hypothetical protein n=1 Tax=Spongiimicrobium sp. 3-5 TaxID=3332596 RepID=UPI0039801A09